MNYDNNFIILRHELHRQHSMNIKNVKIVDGFSERFNELLDMAQFPRKARYSRGAEAFGVSVNAFSDWCQKDEPPGHINVLVEVVKILLENIPGDYDPKAVAGWLQAGNVKGINPFKEYDIEYAVVGDIYLMLTNLADEKNLDLDSELAKNITHSVYLYVLDEERKGTSMRPIKNNETISTILKSKIQLIEIGIE